MTRRDVDDTSPEPGEPGGADGGEREARIRALVRAALDRPPDARAAFADARRAPDAAVRPALPALPGDGGASAAGAEPPAAPGTSGVSRYARVKAIVHAALDRPATERDACLDAACRGDAALRHEAASLLAAAAVDDDFLGGPAGAVWARALAVDAAAASTGAAGARVAAALAGRYAVEDELGRGGMATVYLARDRRHERPVALKVLDPALGAALGPPRFRREITLAASLQHPHIVPVFDSGETTDGDLWYTMPYVAGESLRARLRRDGVLPLPVVVALTGEIAAALAHAHGKGIVHRDVKPENVLLSEDGHALVADFGIARDGAQGEDRRLTGAGLSLGTPAYMSPEQIAGDREIDARTDQYALGCLVHELLTGRPPFAATTAQGVIVKHLLDPVPPLGIEPRTVARALDAVLGRALAKEAAARYATIGEFAQALRAASVAPDVPAVSAPQLGASAIGSLPNPATPLVGRDELLTDALALLRRPDVRLVTCTGAGGAGKTRVAIALGARLQRELAGGVWFVSLAAVADLGDVPTAVRQALRLPEAAGASLGSEIAARLAGRPALLILDDFERHVAVGPWVAELLATAPTLRVLVTSRVRLRLTPEHECRVPPLEVPDLAAATPGRDLATYASVQLFAQRARAVDPSFALSGDSVAAVAEICVRLDGLPLALELAAARVRLLPPRALLERLRHRLRLLTGGARDLPARHQALRDTIAWSYDLLREPERRLFVRLAAFAGGCTLEAAEAVCGADGQLELDVLDGTAALLDASLLTHARGGGQHGEPRVGMLETIREFALEQLEHDPSAAQIRIAHRDWYLALAARAAPMLSGSRQDAWLAVLAAEHANLGLAMDHSVRQADAEAALALGGSLWRYWMVRGHLREGLEWLDRALALPTGGGARALRADALEGAAHLAQNAGDLQAATAYCAAAIALRRQIGDAAGTARGLATHGWIAWLRGEFPEARRLSVDCLALAESLADPRATAQALGNLGWVALYEGDLAAARAAFERGLAVRRELADRRNEAAMLMALAWTASRAGELTRAFTLLEAALPTFRAVGDDLLYAWTLAILAENALRAGDLWRARSVLESEAVPLFRRRGDGWGLGYALTLLSWVERESGNPSRAEELAREGIETCRAVHDPYGEAQALAALAAAARRRGAESEARASYEQSLAMRQRLGDRPGVEECVRALTAAPVPADAVW